MAAASATNDLKSVVPVNTSTAAPGRRIGFGLTSGSVQLAVAAASTGSSCAFLLLSSAVTVNASAVAHVGLLSQCCGTYCGVCGLRNNSLYGKPPATTSRYWPLASALVRCTTASWLPPTPA